MGAAAGAAVGSMAGSLMTSVGDYLRAQEMIGPFRDDPLSQRTGGVIPQADPLMAAMSFDAMLALGYGDLTTARMVLEQASPLQVEKNRIISHPYLTEREKRLQIDALGRNEDLIARQAQYDAQITEKINALGNINDPFIDRLEATQRAGELVGGGNRDSMLAQNRRMLENRRLDEMRRSRERILSESNAGGFNPAGLLGELERENFLLSDSNELNAVNFTNSQVGGELDNILRYLGYGTATAQAASGQRTNASLTAASIAAQNASAADAQRVGPGTSGAGAALSTAGQGFGDAAMLYSLLQPRPQPDTTGKPGVG